MSAQDVYQRINSLGDAGVQKIIERLEFRGKDATFVKMRDEYLNALNIPKDADILDLGCGTGVVSRALAADRGRTGRIVGIDYSPELVEAANIFADNENVSSKIEFRVGDAQALEDADDSYDAVILHTLISHVPDPVATVSESARVVRSGKPVCIFDGDYASMILGTGNHHTDAEVVRAILAAIVANPFVMRELPSIFKQFGLNTKHILPHVHVEVGSLAFFKSMVDTYLPMAVDGNHISQQDADAWLQGYKQSNASKGAFASCNYYAYIAQ